MIWCTGVEISSVFHGPLVLFKGLCMKHDHPLFFSRSLGSVRWPIANVFVHHPPQRVVRRPSCVNNLTFWTSSKKINCYHVWCKAPLWQKKKLWYQWCHKRVKIYKKQFFQILFLYFNFCGEKRKPYGGDNEPYSKFVLNLWRSCSSRYTFQKN